MFKLNLCSNVTSSSEIAPINKEVEVSTETTISCVVSGISKQLDAVVWTKAGTDVTTLTEDNSYVVSAGTYGSNSQTTTLTVKAAVNTADSTYTCVITSNEWLVTNRQTNVALNVFCKNLIGCLVCFRLCYSSHLILVLYQNNLTN